MSGIATSSTIERRQADPTRMASERGRHPAVIDRLEWRAKPDGGLEFEGHAAVFDELSEVLYDWIGPYREKIMRGAFKDVLVLNEAGGEDTKFLALNHNRDLPLSRYGNGSLRLEEDPKGLLATADLAPTQAATDLRVLLERGVVHQMSFTFTVMPDGSEWSFDGTDDIRIVRRVKRLYDVSPVVYPAYPQTDAGMRALGVEIVDGSGAVRERELRALAGEVASGAREASPADRACIEQAYAAIDDVAPWQLERARRALSQEPADQASSQRERSTSSEDAPSGGTGAVAEAAARDRRLRLLARS